MRTVDLRPGEETIRLVTDERFPLLAPAVRFPSSMKPWTLSSWPWLMMVPMSVFSSGCCSASQ